MKNKTSKKNQTMYQQKDKKCKAKFKKVEKKEIQATSSENDKNR